MPNLASGMKIVKTVESKFRNVVEAEPVNFVEQHATTVQSRNTDIAAPALQQQSR